MMFWRKKGRDELDEKIKKMGTASGERIADILLKLRDDKMRQQFVESWLPLMEAWISLLLSPEQQGKTTEEAKLLMSFLQRYFAEERRDVFEGHFIVTNFVVYATLLDPLIQTLKALYPHEQVLFYTQLCLPIYRWFNYHQPVPPPPECQTNPRWVAYIHMISKIAKNKMCTLRRCIPLVSDKIKQHCKSRFQDENSFNKTLQSNILVPYKPDGKKGKEKFKYIHPPPLPSDKIGQLIESQFGELRNFLKKMYDGATAAYIIVPKSIQEAEQILTIDDTQYIWTDLKTLFRAAYHSQATDAKIIRLNDEADYHTRFVEQGLPDDFFIMGTGNFPTPQWKFCLAADVDKKADRLKLWFLSPTLNQAYDPDSPTNNNNAIFTFHQIEDYVQYLLEKGEQLK